MPQVDPAAQAQQRSGAHHAGGQSAPCPRRRCALMRCRSSIKSQLTPTRPCCLQRSRHALGLAPASERRRIGGQAHDSMRRQGSVGARLAATGATFAGGVRSASDRAVVGLGSVFAAFKDLARTPVVPARPLGPLRQRIGRSHLLPDIAVRVCTVPPRCCLRRRVITPRPPSVLLRRVPR